MVAVIMRPGNQVGGPTSNFCTDSKEGGDPRRPHVQQPSLHPLSVLGTMDPASREQC